MNDLQDLSKAWSLCEAVYAFASDDDKKAQDQLNEKLHKDWFSVKGDERRAIERQLEYIRSSEPLSRELLTVLQDGRLIAYGRIGSLAEDITRIPTNFWKSEIEFKLQSNSAHWPGPPKRDIFDIRIISAEAATTTKNPRGAGRPPKFAWEEIIDRFMIHLATEGLPESHAEAIHVIEDIAETLKSDRPSETAIRLCGKKWKENKRRAKPPHRPKARDGQRDQERQDA